LPHRNGTIQSSSRRKGQGSETKDQEMKAFFSKNKEQILNHQRTSASPFHFSLPFQGKGRGWVWAGDGFGLGLPANARQAGVSKTHKPCTTSSNYYPSSL